MELQLAQSAVRSLRVDDAESLARHANNPNIVRNMRDMFPHPYSVDDARQFLDSVMAAEQESAFAIEVDESAVGTIGLRLRTDVDRVAAEMGYWLGEQYWGRGILTEVVRAFTPWALAQFKLTRLEAIVFAGNEASARVLEKTGYQLEATMRRSAIKAGKIIDRWLYAYVQDVNT